MAFTQQSPKCLKVISEDCYYPYVTRRILRLRHWDFDQIWKICEKFARLVVIFWNPSWIHLSLAVISCIVLLIRRVCKLPAKIDPPFSQKFIQMCNLVWHQVKFHFFPHNFGSPISPQQSQTRDTFSGWNRLISSQFLCMLNNVKLRLHAKRLD